MVQTGRRFLREFKLRVIREIVAEVARSYEVHPTTLLHTKSKKANKLDSTLNPIYWVFQP